MAYTTWERVAAKVEGEERLIDLLLPNVEDANDHPFFDDQLAAASGMLNNELARAGYEFPLVTVNGHLEDVTLENALIGVLIGLIKQTSSNREPWIDKYAEWGNRYIRQIGDGEIIVSGAEADETEDTTGVIAGSFADTPVFDTEDPYDGAGAVFSDLSMFGYRRR